MAEPDIKKRCLLFIDDEVSILNAMRKMFERRGHEVHTAQSGEEGLNLYRRFTPDVTVLDLYMPGLSGMEVLRRLVRQKAMVLMLSGQGEITDAVEALKIGAENFLTKPIEMTHMVLTVERAAEKVHLSREVVKLRARLMPNVRRQLARAAIFVGLIGGSAGLGLAIGGSSQGADANLPLRPVRLTPEDTATTVRMEAPQIPLSVPRP